ncbi:MAG: flagellar export chaperone FliS [Gammaproteobacteria bacterium]|nr:flagellar export chaperone FliS [Gammaproteobacteria bacterium]
MSYTTSQHSVNHYKNVDSYTGVVEADPHQLIQMLLDGALEKLSVVKGLIKRNDMASKGEIIGQAIAIVSGLRVSLDMEAGGEIAANLDNLYEYIERRLLEANLKNDISILDESVSLLREIKAAWEAIPHEQRVKPDIATASV